MGNVVINIRWFLLALLIAGISWPLQSQAANAPAAIVIVASGSVHALGEDGFRPVKRRSEIYVGESVLTGPKGRAQLRFSDGALVSMDNNSELLIEAYQRNESEPQKSKALLRMITGGLRSITGAIADDYPERYEVSTPLASIGVRGTDFQLKLSAEKLAVAVWDAGLGASDFASDLTGLSPQLRFTHINTSVTNSDGSINAEVPAGGVTTGFIIPSDSDPSLLGFLGSISLEARDAAGNPLSNGYVTFILESQ